MKCPACPTVSLVMTERSGIEIDYCPDCRGVWLDRGELDKIIERATPQVPVPQTAPPDVAYPADARVRPGGSAWRAPDDDDDHRRPSRERSWEDTPVGKRRKKGLLGDLFDF